MRPRRLPSQIATMEKQKIKTTPITRTSLLTMAGRRHLRLGLRWPIETALEESKGEVGQDHYETRSWLGWHHHMLQSFQSHLFLMRLRLVFKKSPAFTTAQARQLIARAIEQHSDHLLDLGALIHYRQRRNHAAYRSHRKRTLVRHRPRRQKRCFPEVSESCEVSE